MKNFLILLFATATCLFCNCKGSDTYAGTWKAVDEQDNKSLIVFTGNTITIKKAEGEAKTINYVQNSVNYENGSCTYGIQLENGEKYEIFFPNKKRDSGLIQADKQHTLFSIDRNEYLTFEDRFGRKH